MGLNVLQVSKYFISDQIHFKGVYPDVYQASWFFEGKTFFCGDHSQFSCDPCSIQQIFYDIFILNQYFME